jgi:hypothetical protein
MPTKFHMLTGLHGRQAHRIVNARAFRNGGLWFVRLGRLQFSFCVCRGVL